MSGNKRQRSQNITIDKSILLDISKLDALQGKFLNLSKQ